MADSLSEGVLAEILKELPVKSLLRFRCVQKSWYHLIKSRYFIHLHSHHRQNKNKYLLFQDRHHSKLSLRVDDKQCKEYQLQLRLPVPDDLKERSDLIICIRGTCRGLICFSVTSYKLVPQVFLWNPVINISKTLPDSPIPYDAQILRSPSLLGLAVGYFPSTRDYKVIKIESYFTAGGEARPEMAFVYINSLSSNSWKTIIVDNFARISGYSLYNSVVVNGGAYWIGMKDSPRKTLFACFDVENETIRDIMLPPQYSPDSTYIVNLVEHHGELVLYLVYIEELLMERMCDILVLEKDGKQNEVWRKKVSFYLHETLWPIGCRNNGDLVLALASGRFWSYDHEKKVKREMIDDPSGLMSYAQNDVRKSSSEFFQLMYVNTFDENLVLLGHE